MNTLNLHIQYLTGRHDCVIVPGFGAFIIERIPSRIDSRSLTVYEPEVRVGFNPELRDDDGLLIHSIARRSKINHQEARRIVDHTVHVIKDRLAEGHSVEIPEIGSFIQTEDGKKVFSPFKRSYNSYSLPLLVKEETSNVKASPAAETGNGLIDYAGSFHPHSEDTQEETGESTTELSVLPDIKDRDILESKQKNSREEEKITFNTRRNFYIPVNKMFARVACVLVILACSFLVITRQSEQTTGEIQKASVVPVESLINIRNSGDTTKKVIEEKKSEEELSSPIEQLPYHLIVATFRSQEEAERFIAESEDDSTAMTPVKGKGNLWRVAVASGSDRAELQKKLNDVNSRFEGSWIWERR